MKKTRFTDEQMVTILLEADTKPVPDVAKKHGCQRPDDLQLGVWPLSYPLHIVTRAAIGILTTMAIGASLTRSTRASGWR